MDGVAELVPVLPAHRFDEAALARHLRGQLPGFDGQLTVRQFQGGQSNPTFHLQTAGGEYVLRKKPPGKLLPRAHEVEREYRVMSALRDTDVPVPRMRLLCDDESVIGTTFFVMDYVPGRIFTDPALPQSSPEHRAAIYEDLARVLAALHRVDWRGAGLEGFGRPEGYLQPRWRCGRDSGGPRAWRTCPRWTCWRNGYPNTCHRTTDRPVSPTATTAWVTS